MPIYEFEDVRTGERVELFRTVARRDEVPKGLRRVISLTGRGPFTGQAIDPSSAAAAVPRAFRQVELSGIPREKIERDSGFSVRDIKNTWQF